MVRVLVVGSYLLAAWPAAAAVLADGYTCPRGLKYAAGACVSECPGGYADTGSRCEYRSMGGGGGGK